MITDKMIEAAQDAYMPFGDMGMALMCAFSVSVDKIEPDTEKLADEIARRGQLLTECLELLMDTHSKIKCEHARKKVGEMIMKLQQ